VADKGERLEDVLAIELYSRLKDQAEQMRLTDFTKRYKNPVSLGNRLVNIMDELNEVMIVEVKVESHNRKLYSFRPLVALGALHDLEETDGKDAFQGLNIDGPEGLRG
jgi:hypothetical protein